MSATIVQSAYIRSVSGDASQSVSLTNPATAGNIIYYIRVGGTESDNQARYTPTGFTFAEANSGNNQGYTISYKVAASGETGPYTPSSTPSDNGCMAIIEVSGAASYSSFWANEATSSAPWSNEFYPKNGMPSDFLFIAECDGTNTFSLSSTPSSTLEFGPPFGDSGNHYSQFYIGTQSSGSSPISVTTTMPGSAGSGQQQLGLVFGPPSTIQVNQAGLYAASKTNPDLSVNQAGVLVSTKTIPDVNFNMVGVYVASKNTKTLYCWARQKDFPTITAVTPAITITYPIGT